MSSRLGAVEITQSYSQMLTNYSSSSQLSNKEKMLQNAEVKSLREIKELSKVEYSNKPIIFVSLIVDLVNLHSRCC